MPQPLWGKEMPLGCGIPHGDGRLGHNTPMPRMNDKQLSRDIWQRWWNGLDARTQRAKGTIAGALQVLENLKADYDPRPASQRTANGEQLKNAGAANLAKILARHGEHRPFLREGGRTNRGLLPTVDQLLKLLRDKKLGALSKARRDAILGSLQKIAARKASDFLNAKKLRIKVRNAPFARTIDLLLDEARQRGKSGQVAQYLVGAKLELRFPNTEIANRSASSADQSAGEEGDFRIDDSVFHVTVSPTPAHIQKCFDNMEAGLRAFLLVADDKMQAARQMIETHPSAGGENISVYSVEAFVSQNISELAEFSPRKESATLRDFLETYNRRVEEVESDLSLLVDFADGPE